MQTFLIELQHLNPSYQAIVIKDILSGSLATPL